MIEKNTQDISSKVVEFLKSSDASFKDTNDDTADYVRSRELHHSHTSFMQSVRYNETLVDKEPTDIITAVVVSDNEDRS